MLVGYARVSTSEQETRLQLDALKAAGVEIIYAEKTSGAGPRPELQRAISSLIPGSTLVVYKVDRLARSLKDLLALLDRLRAGGAGLRSLTEPVDTSPAMGELVLQILGAVAQFERSLIREPCEAGRAAARARGVSFGRKRIFTQDDDILAYDLYTLGTLGYREVGALLGVSYTAARQAVRREQARRT